MNPKNSLIIIVIVALIFLATILFLENSVIMLTAIFLFMLGYSYFKWKNKHKAEEEIRAVVASYIKPDSVWPTKIAIPEERLNELKISLANKKVVLPPATINKMVEEMLVSEMEALFESSFYAHNPDLPKDPGIHQWIDAYIMTFNRNMDYVPLLQRLMKRRGIKHPVGKLEEKIEEEIKKKEKNKKQLKQLTKKSYA
ncbi:MAG TPA: hypothetical protein VN381_13960 [Anaerovoracaceae bacterium]|nr:hypothetical protein [Anaerovoracaceae bacterium]